MNIFGLVHADTLVGGHYHLDGYVIFKQSELLEFFRTLEGAWPQGDKSAQNLHAERIQADVAIELPIGVHLMIGNRETRKL